MRRPTQPLGQGEPVARVNESRWPGWVPVTVWESGEWWALSDEGRVVGGGGDGCGAFPAGQESQ